MDISIEESTEDSVSEESSFDEISQEENSSVTEEKNSVTDSDGSSEVLGCVSGVNGWACGIGLAVIALAVAYSRKMR